MGERALRETTGTVPRLHVATAAYGPTRQEKNAKLQARNASIVVNLDISPKYADRD